MGNNGYTGSWTLERVEQMTTLWSDGYSAGMIAKELGGFDTNKDGGRCAVIGKLFRLGLIGSGEKPRYTLPRGNGHRRVKSGVPVPQTRSVSVARIRKWQKRLARIVIVEPQEAPQSLGKTLLELRGGECKWPAGDGPYTFCANPVEAGPYCSWHRSIAFTKGTQRDVDRIASRAMGGITGEGKSTIMEV